MQNTVVQTPPPLSSPTFSSQNKTLYGWSTHSPSPPPLSPWQPLVGFLSLWICCLFFLLIYPFAGSWSVSSVSLKAPGGHEHCWLRCRHLDVAGGCRCMACTHSCHNIWTRGMGEAFFLNGSLCALQCDLSSKPQESSVKA